MRSLMRFFWEPDPLEVLCSAATVTISCVFRAAGVVGKEVLRYGLLVLIACSSGAFAAGIPLADAANRVEELDRLLGRQRPSAEELVAAVDAVGFALKDLDPATDPRERARFRDRAAHTLLKALRLENVEWATKRNLGNGVQLAAARALVHVDPDKAPDVMRVLEVHIISDRPYEVDPSFYDAVLDPLMRLNTTETFDWVLDKVVNADTQVDSREQTLAGLDALLHLRATGAQRCAAVKRLVAIYTTYISIENSAFEVAGFRGAKFGKLMQGTPEPYWEVARPTIMRTLRELSVDPCTGLPPFDLDTKEPIGTLQRHRAWFEQNKKPGRPPWTDAPAAPRMRADVPFTRPLSPAWIELGVPWQEAWRTSRKILDRPLAAAAWRDELRGKTLPEVAKKALGDPAWEVRAAAALTIARISADRAAERLHERVDNDASEPVREAAMLGLLLLADGKERDFLRARAADEKENPRLRAYAILALGFLRDAEPVRAFVGSDDASDDLRACAVRAFGHAGVAGSDIAALLADKRQAPALRGEAGPALLGTKDASVLPDLLPILHERVSPGDVPVAQASVAIAMGLCTPDNAKMLRRLRGELRDATLAFAGVRTLLANSLSRIQGAPGAAALLVDEYGSVRPKSTRFAERGHLLLALGRASTDAAKEILEKEIEVLEYEWDLGACALGLALAGDYAGLARLRTLLPERGDTYAPHGMMALALLSDPAGRFLIRDALRQRRADAVLEEGALALALLDGEKALPDLLALWERGRFAEHFDAFAWAFRLAATPDAIPPLCAIVAGDRDPVQRAFALMALGRMADPAAALHDLARNSNPYTGSPTLLDLVRWRDAAPLLD